MKYLLLGSGPLGLLDNFLHAWAVWPTQWCNDCRSMKPLSVSEITGCDTFCDTFCDAFCDAFQFISSLTESSRSCLGLLGCRKLNLEILKNLFYFVFTLKGSLHSTICSLALFLSTLETWRTWHTWRDICGACDLKKSRKVGCLWKEH